jgi:hypothetical protein
MVSGLFPNVEKILTHSVLQTRSGREFSPYMTVVQAPMDFSLDDALRAAIEQQDRIDGAGLDDVGAAADAEEGRAPLADLQNLAAGASDFDQIPLAPPTPSVSAPVPSIPLTSKEKRQIHAKNSRKKRRDRKRALILEDSHSAVRDSMVRRYATAVRVVHAKWNSRAGPACRTGYTACDSREKHRELSRLQEMMIAASKAVGQKGRSALQALLSQGFDLVEWNGQ